MVEKPSARRSDDPAYGGSARLTWSSRGRPHRHGQPIDGVALIGPVLGDVRGSPRHKG